MLHLRTASATEITLDVGHWLDMREGERIEVLADSLTAEVQRPLREPTWQYTFKNIRQDYGIYGRFGWYHPSDDFSTEDASDAIQEALDDAAEAPEGVMPVIYFPESTVRITRALTLPKRVMLVALGRANILQSCTTCAHFVGSGTEVLKVHGLQFSKSLRHFQLDDVAEDATILIEDSEFDLATDVAVRITGGTTNGLAVIRRSRFIYNHRAVSSQLKTLVVADGWVGSHPTSETQFSQALGRLFFLGVLTNPEADPSTRSPTLQWIGASGSVYALQTRFGGEYAGIGNIRYGAIADESAGGPGTEVIIANSQVSSGANFPGFGIFRPQNAFPARLDLVGNRWGFSGDPDHGPFVVGSNETLSALFAPLAPLITIRGNEALLARSLEDTLQPVLREQAPGPKLAIPMVVQPRDIVTPDLIRELAPWAGVNVKDHGAVGDGVTDDTAAIQAALETLLFGNGAPRGNFLDGSSNAVLIMPSQNILYFPPGHYRVSDSLGRAAQSNYMSPNLRVFAAGDATVEQTCSTCSIFSGGWVQSYQGMRFIGGRHAIDFSNANTAASELFVRDCVFEKQNDTAITMYSTLANDGHLSTLALVERSRFDGTAFRNVGDLATVRRIDVAASGTGPMIDNHYGALSLEQSRFSGTVDAWIRTNTDLNFIGNTVSGTVVSRVAAPDTWSYKGTSYSALQYRSTVFPYMGGVLNLSNNRLTSDASLVQATSDFFTKATLTNCSGITPSRSVGSTMAGLVSVNLGYEVMIDASCGGTQSAQVDAFSGQWVVRTP